MRGMAGVERDGAEEGLGRKVGDRGETPRSGKKRDSPYFPLLPIILFLTDLNSHNAPILNLFLGVDEANWVSEFRIIN